MLPVYQPYLSGKEKEYVNQCFDSSWISSKGEFISKFESLFADYIGIEYATSVCNGTVALHLALETLDIGPGDEVIVPTLTYVASVNTIIQVGAKPVFVDSIEESWQLDPEDVRRKINAKTKAIMAVHLYGLPCNMEALVQICTEHNLLLIEDCAEAFGTHYKHRHVGTFGNIATFSFFGNKTITTGEGGMLITNDKLLIDKAYHLKNQGVSKTREYWHDELAYNYRMTNICAAIGLAQLEQADLILEKKRQVALWYQEGLMDLPLEMQVELPETKHSYWMCSIATDNSSLRQTLREYLKNEGIETRPTFYPAHTLPHCQTMERFPVAESLSARGINLPSYPDLTKKDVQRVCDAIRSFFLEEGVL